MEPDKDRAALADALEDLSIKNTRPDPDIPRPVIQTTRTTSKTNSFRPKTTKAKNPVADSWEDDLSSGSDSEVEGNKDEGSEIDAIKAITTTAHSTKSNLTEAPYAPPPTPLSRPSVPHPGVQKGDYEDYQQPLQEQGQVQRNHTSDPSIRPEKQTAVANRMIAGALGLRAPKRTEEQRAYDRAMKEKEIKRRNRAKEEEARAIEEEERAKAAVWHD